MPNPFQPNYPYYPAYHASAYQALLNSGLKLMGEEPTAVVKAPTSWVQNDAQTIGQALQQPVGNSNRPNGAPAYWKPNQPGFFQSIPGLDFVLNPDKYPASASLLNSTGWNTYASRKQKEQAGSWVNQPYRYQVNDDPLKIAEQNNITPAQLLAANPGGAPFSVGQNINLPTWKEAPASTMTATVTPQQPALNPAQPYSGFEPIRGGDNTDYANTAAARAYAAAGTPFLQQQRYDPQTRRMVSIGRLLRQGKLDLQGNWHRRRRGGGGGGGRQAQQAQASQDYTLANSLIKFSVGSG